MVCTFFGHRNTPKEIEPTLRSVLIDLIENKNVDTFYMGNQGNFDSMAKSTLSILKTSYPNISCTTVLAYLPHKINKLYCEDFRNTLYPEGIENSPPKFAIIKRNFWMLDNADFVVTYVRHPTGGAARFKETAEKKGKIVLNLPDITIK